MDMMDISDLACVPIPASQPDLTPLRVPAISHAPVSIPPHSHSQTQPTVGSHTDNASVRQSLQPTVTGRKSEAQKNLNSSSHQSTILTSAHGFCESQSYVDLHIQCEDGTIKAHQMMLAVASPFLKQLFQLSRCSCEKSCLTAACLEQEPLYLVMPETKVSLVQALLHFLYTGNVVTQEGQFYSLMKLVYALNINASIEAESTPSCPTEFKTKISQIQESSIKNSNIECHCGRQPGSNKKAKYDIDSENNLLNSSNLNKVTSSLAVNSFTASGVVVKEELDEKPSFLSTLSPIPPTPIPVSGPVGDKSNKTEFPSLLSEASANTGTNNNQLGHFVSVNPGFQIKMEIPGQVGSNNDSGSQMSQQPGTNSSSNSNQSSSVLRQGDSSSDDPLAAIMNQTIFGGDNINTMFIQVNTSSYLSAQNSNIPTMNANLPKDKGGGGKVDETGPIINEEVVTPSPLQEDDDLNVSYTCDICNKQVKGKVMLQAHKFQEHHDNPEYEASSFPEDKFACRVCLKLFTRNSDVKAHILRVHCGDRRYPCTTCGKRFKESTHLRKHLYTHTGERPHFCTLCSKGFQTSSDLKRHKKTRIHQEKVEQAAGDTVAAVTAAAAANAANANAAVHDVSMEFGDWTDNADDSKDVNSNHNNSLNAFNPGNNCNSLPFPSTVSLPTEPCPPTSDLRVTNGSNSFTATSTNFINQNSNSGYTGSLSTDTDQDQKPTLWPSDDSSISNLMMSTMSSSTLDLSPLDIKWGILDQDAPGIKREQDKPLGDLSGNLH